MGVLVIVFSSLFYLILRVKRNVHMLQQNFYNENNRYIKWGFKKFTNMFSVVDMYMVIINLVNLIFENNLLMVLNLFYLIFYYNLFRKNKNSYYKLPLKITSRVKRLFCTIFFIYIIVLIGGINIKDVYLFNFIYSLLVMLVFFVVGLANILNIPLERLVFLKFKNKALKKLKVMNNLEVIGITGSYGKTSSKNVLNEILGVKFNTIATPANFNTQYGLIITINNYINKFNDIFIAEMGAFKRGRIKLLCDLVKPKYGIVTSIGIAHLETFGSRENICECKFELIESLPSDGVAILNMDDHYQVSYNIKNNCKVIWIGIDNKDADIIASNIKIDMNGTSFDVNFKKDKLTYRFSTRLLGKVNVYNILSGIAFGYYKGMSIEEIDIGVRKIKPVAHRLELKKNRDYIIIDDAYNSNPVGSKMALEVLGLMDGLRIVVTPGMIELGDEEYDLNKKFGEYISEVADYVILVGEEQTKPIVDGLEEKKYDREKVFVINDVREAFNIIDGIKTASMKYVLLENDLPDIFNEK